MFIVFSELDSNDKGVDVDNIPGDIPEPIDILIEVEEFLVEQYGLTYIQACKLGVFK